MYLKLWDYKCFKQTLDFQVSLAYNFLVYENLYTTHFII